MVLKNLLKLCGCWLQKYPTRGNAILTATILGTGDCLAQLVIEKKKQYDFKRTARMVTIGAFYIGPAVSTWYIILDKIIGPTHKNNKMCAVFKISLDQLIFAPIVTSGFISIIALADGKNPKEEVTRKLPDIMITNWELWPLVQFINFSYVPLHLRTGFVQFISIFWNTYLAWKLHQ